MFKVFIDGSAGTTGLKIYQRLSDRKDIELISLTEELRKDISARKDALNSADVAFLCLPDSAAIEAVSLVENANTAIIDTSTAHRTNPDWAYGFPEIANLREKIKNSKRIANPGCHASGFISLVQPLVEKGLINKDVNLTCFSLTGYTGGGKKMIAEYEGESLPELYKAPRQYGLTQTHKHLPEMKAVCALDNEPIFCPIVANFDRGMEVTVPLFKKDLNGNVSDIINAYKSVYTGEVVKYVDDSENGFLSANAMKNKDGLKVSVCGNDERILLVARFDNLGKGASGAAVQCFNIMHGLDETLSLEL